MHPRTLLILSCVGIVVLWQLPYGRQVLYPLTLLATYAHEMGHGLTALAFGATFEQLLLHPDGSGMAVWSGNPGRVATALIAAGGLVGPTLAGVCILLLSRSVRWARWVMATLALLIAVSVLLFSVSLTAGAASASAVTPRSAHNEAKLFWSDGSAPVVQTASKIFRTASGVDPQAMARRR